MALALENGTNSYVEAIRRTEVSRAPEIGIDPISPDALARIEVGTSAKSAGLVDLTVSEVSSLARSVGAPDRDSATFRGPLANLILFGLNLA